jgi:hypothetical protein
MGPVLERFAGDALFVGSTTRWIRPISNAGGWGGVNFSVKGALETSF